MGSIHIITGGGRSGKSRFALRWAANLGRRKCFIATCPKLDLELTARIEAHQKERANLGWNTIEEEIDILSFLNGNYNVFLLDCLTLWINNLMYRSEQNGEVLTEAIISQKCRVLIQKVACLPSHLVIVTNEVGMGIIPGEAATRLFRDLVGRANQIFAEASNTAILMSCGIPLLLKGDLKNPNLANPDGGILC